MTCTSGENVCTYKLPERFNADTSGDLMAELKDLPDGDCDCVILDMSDTVSMDSSGIGVLVYLYKELTAQSKPLILKKPQRGIYNLLTETGVDKLFDVELSSGLKKAEVGLNELDVKLHMEEKAVGNGVCVVSLNGVMNYPAGSAMFKKRMTLALADSSKILLDFSELAFFDSLSVGAILRVSRLLASSGGEMRICCANHVVRDMFESLGVDAIVQLYDTKEEALDGW